MVDKKIEPFEYQASTNIDEHNQIVGKLNEVVDAINEVNLDEIAPEIADLDTRVDKNTTDISQLKISDAEHTEQIATIDSNVDNHAREITALKTADAKHDTEIAELDKLTDALTKEIPNGITLYRDGTGKIKAVISQEDDTTIDSNTLDMIIPYQYTIISGTSSRSFKLKIVMSDGSEVITNDFIIPEGGGSVVTITGIEIDKDATDVNKFLVKAIVNEGDPITSNAITMVDSVSGTFANNKLTIKVNGVASTPITIDTTGTTYTAGNGIKIASGVISIDDTKVALKSDISDMETKTNANATFATKTALTALQNSVGDAFSQVAVGSDGKSLDFTALDGQVNNVVLPSSGGEWNVSSKTLDDLVIRDADTYGFKITEEFIIEIIVLEAYSKESSGLFNIEHIHVYPIEIRKPATKPSDFPTDGAYEYVDTVYFISRKHPYIQAYKSWGLGKGNYVKIIAYTNQTTFTDAVYTNKTDLSEFYPYEYGESSMGYRSEYDNVIYRILTKS